MDNSAARRPAHGRLSYLLALACALVLVGWGLYALRTTFIRKAPPLTPPPPGRFVTIKQYESSLTFQTEDGLIVTIGGISVEDLDQAARARAGARLRELAPTGAVVFVERDLGALPAGAGAVTASVWLPPPGTPKTLPFPYQQSRLVAGILVQEGLVRVDEAQHYIFQNELLMLEDDARRHEHGMWAPK